MKTSRQIRRAGVAVLIVLGVAVSAGCGGRSGRSTSSGSDAVAAAQATYNAYARAHQSDPAFAGREVRKCYVDPGLTVQSQGIAPGSVWKDFRFALSNSSRNLPMFSCGGRSSEST